LESRPTTTAKCDLKHRVEAGEFREDLYYRIAEVPVPMPWLRDRREDIPVLIERFLADASRELKVPRRSLAPGGLHKLQAYSFPGNIRELRNLIERACLFAQGEWIGPEDFPVPVLGGTAGSSPVQRLLQALPPSIDLREGRVRQGGLAAVTISF
jgi:DNA-binding NtrC family response regulator